VSKDHNKGYYPALFIKKWRCFYYQFIISDRQVFIKNYVLNIFSVNIFYFNRHFFTIEASRSEIQEWLGLAKDF